MEVTAGEREDEVDVVFWAWVLIDFCDMAYLRRQAIGNDKIPFRIPYKSKIGSYISPIQRTDTNPIPTSAASSTRLDPRHRYIDSAKSLEPTKTKETQQSLRVPVSRIAETTRNTSGEMKLYHHRTTFRHLAKTLLGSSQIKGIARCTTNTSAK